jgi:uncharacterized membrane protein YfcA
VKTQRSADIAVGCFLAFLGLVTLYASSMIRGGMEERLPPRTLPYVVGVTILLCGIGLAVKSWRFRGADPAIKWPDREGLQIIIVNLVFLGFYIALMEPLGLPLSTFLYIAIAVWYLKKTKWLNALIISLATAATSYYLFIRLLELSFPVGFFLQG